MSLHFHQGCLSSFSGTKTLTKFFQFLKYNIKILIKRKCNLGFFYETWTLKVALNRKPQGTLSYKHMEMRFTDIGIRVAIRYYSHTLPRHHSYTQVEVSRVYFEHNNYWNFYYVYSFEIFNIIYYDEMTGIFFQVCRCLFNALINFKPDKVIRFRD